MMDTLAQSIKDMIQGQHDIVIMFYQSTIKIDAKNSTSEFQMMAMITASPKRCLVILP